MMSIFTPFKDRGLTINKVLVASRQVLTNLSVLIPRNSEQIHGKLRMLLAAVIYSSMLPILVLTLLVASVSVWGFLVSCKAYQVAEKQLKIFT